MEISDGNPKLKQTDCWALHIRQGSKRDLGGLWPPSTCFKTIEEKREEKVSTRESSIDARPLTDIKVGRVGPVRAGWCLWTSSAWQLQLVCSSWETLLAHTHTHTHTHTLERGAINKHANCWRGWFTYSSKRAATVPPSKKTEYPELLCRVNKRL